MSAALGACAMKDGPNTAGEVEVSRHHTDRGPPGAAVENYAVIERVRVRFHRGLNLLTGETGSGKSMVVDALGLLFGGRASADMVRAGADRARISGIFEVSPTRP